MASDEQQSAPQLASQASEQQATDAIASLTLEERQGSAAEPPAPPPGRHAGYVRWFNASKGYGFICEGGKEAMEGASGEAPQDLFVHQSSIRAEGFRSLREGEFVEFDVEPGEDGRNKAINVSGPGGAAPLGAPKRPAAPQRRLPIQHQPQHLQQPPSPHMLQPGQQQQIQQYAGGYGGFPGSGGYPSAAGMYSGGYPGAGPAGMYPGSGGGYPGSGGGSGYPPNPSMGMFQPPRGLPPHMRPPLGIPGGFPGQLPGGRGRGGGVADRRPPPGTPGVSSGLQVVVHNLPWTCSWQQLKDAFVEAGVANIERADVIIDSSGRSRGFGTVSFPTPQDAAAAVQNMNNADIGGRAVTVRIDRFA